MKSIVMTSLFGAIFLAALCAEQHSLARRSAAGESGQRGLAKKPIQTCGHRGRYVETEEISRKELVEFPDDGCLVFHLGRSLVGQRKFEEAILCDREILRVHSERKAPRRELCNVLITLGRRSELERVRAEWPANL